MQVHNLLLSFLLRSPTKNSFEETLFKSLHHYPPLYNSPRRDFDESKNTAFGKRLQRRWYLLLSFDSLRTCTQTFTFRSGWMILDTERVFVLPHVGTSSSADEVCSSVDGFFLPSPMILVIFFPAPFPTVPVFCSDFAFFFPFPKRERETVTANLIHDFK